MKLSTFVLSGIAAALAVSTIALPTIAKEMTVEVGGAPMYPSKNIIQNAVNSKDHTTLVAAVKAAGLVDTLSGKGPFTVFAPTNDAFAKLKTKNKLNVSLQHAGKWWVASPNHPNFTAAAKAVEKVWGVKPDLTREGGSIPVTLTFETATGKNVLLLPMGSSTDAAHSINEKLDKRNYIEGTKLLGSYLHYIAEEPMDTK